MENNETFFCQICNEPKIREEVVQAQSVSESMARLIRAEYPAWSSGGYICRVDLDRFKAQYIQEVMENEKMSSPYWKRLSYEQ